jgi:hypothetical protein
VVTGKSLSRAAPKMVGSSCLSSTVSAAAISTTVSAARIQGERIQGERIQADCALMRLVEGDAEGVSSILPSPPQL